MAAIYLGNLTDNAEYEIRRWLPERAQFHFDPELMVGSIQLPDLPEAQELARQLDGSTLDGQPITAIERTRLETALTAARSPRRNATLAALATRLGLTELEPQACLLRLVYLLGITVVLQAADLTQDQASFFNFLLNSFHPVVRHALRCGSLRQAESLRHVHAPRNDCSPILDPVVIEHQRRQEICRQARQRLDRLEQEGVEGPTLTRARERLRETERDLAAFWERFDLPARLQGQPASAAWRPKPISVSDNWEERQ